MVDMGAEVGQKMRSAIKAKLTELDCYVDDELPDYIMVMVANKRTKSQMNEDLALFLNTKTSVFVDWLHIVLKKLKEVTVTNLDVYKKASKRKSSDSSSVKAKKEKKVKKEKSVKIENSVVKEEEEKASSKSLTDDLPFNVKNLADNRRIILSEANLDKPSQEQAFDIPSISEVYDSNHQELEQIEKQIKNVKSRLGLKLEEDVEEAELRRIVENSMKKKLAEKNEASKNQSALLSDGRSISIDQSRSVHISPTESQGLETPNTNSPNGISEATENTRREHTRITFFRSDLEESSPPRKKSILERLGKYGSDEEFKPRLNKFYESSKRRQSSERSQRDRILEDDIRRVGRKEERNLSSRLGSRNNISDHKSERTERRLSPIRGSRSGAQTNCADGMKSLDGLKKDLKKRLGLSSKVTVAQIDAQLLDDTFKKREVVSVVKVKPRVLPPNMKQANKNLLLKAVADAQKSIAQSKSVGNNRNGSESPKYEKRNRQMSPEALYTRKYKFDKEMTRMKRISHKEKEHVKRIISSHVSSNKDSSDETEEQQYIPKPIKRTLSNVEYVPSSVGDTPEENDAKRKQQFIVTLDGVKKEDIIGKVSAKDRLDGRRTPSPIIFEDGKGSSAPKIPARIDKSKIPDELPKVSVVSNKSKEKCKYFPLCRNGEKCEFLHPSKNCEQFPYCKFGEKCLYIHPSCKFGTSCTRRDCPYSHSVVSRNAVPAVPLVQSLPTCKYFPNCTNISCSFYHPKSLKFGNFGNKKVLKKYSLLPNKSSLTWRSK